MSVAFPKCRQELWKELKRKLRCSDTQKRSQPHQCSHPLPYSFLRFGVPLAVLPFLQGLVSALCPSRGYGFSCFPSDSTGLSPRTRPCCTRRKTSVPAVSRRRASPSGRQLTSWER